MLSSEDGLKSPSFVTVLWRLLSSCDGWPILPLLQCSVAFHPGRIRSLARGGLDQLAKPALPSPDRSADNPADQQFCLWTVLSM